METYLGAHIANDAGWVEEGEDDEKNEEENESNIDVSHCFEFVASKSIKTRDEILYDDNDKNA